LGANPDPLRTLFGETAGCLLVEVSPQNKIAFEAIMENLPCRLLGTVETDPTLHAANQGAALMDVELPALVKAWKDRVIEGGQG